MKFFHVMRTEGSISHVNPDHIEYYEPWADDSTALYFVSGRQMNINETIDSFRARLAEFDSYMVTATLEEIDESEKAAV